MKRALLAAISVLASLVPTATRADVPGMEVIPLQSVNLRLGQCNAASISGSIVAVAVDESYQSEDLDGDGLLSSNVLVYRDITKPTAKNTRIAVSGGGVGIEGDLIVMRLPSGTLGVYAIKDTPVFKHGLHDTLVPMGGWFDGRKSISGGRVVFQGTDGQVSVYDLASKVVTAIAPGGGATISGSIVAFGSGTIQYYDLAAGTLTDTGIGGGSPVTDGSGIVFEASSTNTLAYYDIQSGQLVDLGFRDLQDFGFGNGTLVMMAREGSYWGDLNGDGVVGKRGEMAVVYDVRTGRLVNTRVESCCGGDVDNGIAVFDVWEGQVGYDLIGDGYDSDCVQHYLSIRDLFP